MPLLDQIRADELIRLARQRFDRVLKKAEMRVIRDSASSEELPKPGRGVKRPVVRAGFLRWLATDPETAPLMDPKGLRVYAATIPGALDLRGCHLAIPLDCRRCEFQGTINLVAAKIGGVFLIDSSVAGGISADRAAVDGPLLLRRLRVKSEICLAGAEVGGEFGCTGSRLKGAGIALNAGRIKVGGSVFLDHGFVSAGSIHLLGAEIGGNLDCSGARLCCLGHSLAADGARIRGDVFLTRDAASGRGFQSLGEIRLPGAEIGGDLDCSGAEIRKMSCYNMKLGGDLIWLRIEKVKSTWLNLAGATVKNLRDDKKSWPWPGNLLLDQLRYEEVTLQKRPTRKDLEARQHSPELVLDVDERIEWIMRQPSNRCAEPQPWMQLRELLEKKGERRAARHVVYRFRCVQAQGTGVLSRATQTAFAWVEEAPPRILWFVGVTFVLFASIFWYAGAKGALAPTEKDAYEAFVAGAPLKGAYPRLNPFVYTLENALPLVKLGQDDKWAPDPGFPSKQLATNYWFLMWSRWILVIWGWFQAGILGAAVIERFKPK
jgi:hypothetical protein